MATNKSKSTAPATINPKNFTIPLRKEFIDYLQPFKTRGSANSYATYVKNIVDGYYNQTGINLSTPIDGCSIIYHKDRDTILQIIFSEVYTNRHELGINDKKLSGFLSYMDFISEFQTNQIRKLLKGYYCN